MTWYPDWVVALDEVSRGIEYATVTRRNAQDVIREIGKMQARIAELETSSAENASRAADDMARRRFCTRQCKQPEGEQ